MALPCRAAVHRDAQAPMPQGEKFFQSGPQVARLTAQPRRPAQGTQTHGGVKAHGQAGVERHGAGDLGIDSRVRRETGRPIARTFLQHHLSHVHEGFRRSQCALQSRSQRQAVQAQGPRQVVAAAHGHKRQRVVTGPQGRQPAVDGAIATKGQHPGARWLVLDEVQRFGHRVGQRPMGLGRPQGQRPSQGWRRAAQPPALGVGIGQREHGSHPRC